MKKLLLISLLVLLNTACKPVQQVPIQTKTIVRDRLVNVPVPADSSWFYALLACDSLNNVYVKSFNESKSNTINQNISIQDNKLTGKFKSNPTPVQAKVHDSIVYQEVPVKVPGETKTVYQMRWYQQAFMWIGILAVVLITIFTAWKLMKK